MSATLTTDTISPDLQRRLRAAQNPQKALQAAALAVVEMTKTAWTDSSLRPTSWPALKDSTLRKKLAKAQSSSILYATGELSKSPRVISVTRTDARVGSHVRAGSYSMAAIHQLGAPRRNIPARPFFPFHASGQATELVKKRVRAAIVANLVLPT